MYSKFQIHNKFVKTYYTHTHTWAYYGYYAISPRIWERVYNLVHTPPQFWLEGNANITCVCTSYKKYKKLIFSIPHTPTKEKNFSYIYKTRVWTMQKKLQKSWYWLTLNRPLSGGGSSPGGAVPSRGLLAAGECSLRWGEVLSTVGLVLGRDPAGLKLRPLDDDDCLPALLGPEINPDWLVLIDLKTK